MRIGAFALSGDIAGSCRLLSCFWTPFMEPMLLKTAIVPLQVCRCTPVLLLVESRLRHRRQADERTAACDVRL